LATAILARWAAALIAIPLLICLPVVWRRRTAAAVTRHCAVAAVVALVCLSPVLGPASRHVAGSAAESGAFIGDLQVIGWDASNLFRSEFVGLDGVLRFNVVNAAYYAVVPARWFFFTPLLAPFILPAVVELLRRRVVVPMLLLFAWPAVTLGFVAGMANQNPRFALMVVPPIAVLLAIGLSRMARTAGRRWQILVWTIGVVGFVWMIAGGVRLTLRFVERKAEDLATVRWAESRLPPDARLFTFGITTMFEHYSRLRPHNLNFPSPSGLAGVLADGVPAFVLLDIPNIETQWRDRPPAVSLQWLRDGPGLTELDRRGVMTLFRVGR
jgi:hypothetical protein